jgi:putative ABC transport system permease protein
VQLRTRWYKILNDIFGNKNRSILVVLSIAVGVGVVGMINNARFIIEQEIGSQYEWGNPASVSIYVSPFEKELSTAVENMREVEIVQPRRFTGAKIILSDGEEDVNLVTVPEYDDIKVNNLLVESGSSEIGLRTIALERQSAKALDVKVGDQITIEMHDGNLYTLTLVSIYHDIYELPYSITKTVSGHVSMETLQWLGEVPYYSRIDLITADDRYDRENVLDIAALARDRVIEPAGYYVGSIQIPGIDSDPGKHWAQNQINGFVLILQVMSVMAIFLSGGLVVNTISAILTQQVKQIGIMRSIGAVPSQIAGMYILNILGYSFIGWALAIPMGILGSYGLAKYAASFLNFSVSGLSVSLNIILLQTLIAMIIPVGVALYPIIAGTSIKIYDAIYQQGLVNESQKPWLERLLGKLKVLKPPVVLSILNTFRNVPRLAFTLVTLTLAGATFVAAFSTRASLNEQIVEMSRYVNYDAAISIPSSENLHTVEREALRIPGIVLAEGWAQATGKVVYQDQSEGEELTIIGLPYDTQTIAPKLLSGRWLTPTDSWQVVVNQDLVDQEEDIQVGSTIDIEVMGKEHSYTVVGVLSKHLSGPRVYINYSMFSKITGRNDQINELRVRTDVLQIASEEEQEVIRLQLEERLSNAGITDSSAHTQADISSYFSEPFGIILFVLVIMASLLAIVGGLSLTGTMGINVMERTREIGVLRSVGASNSSVRQVVVVEGVMIALISWLLVSLISGPTGAALASAVLFAVLKTQLTFQFSHFGLIIWMAIVVVIGVITSLSPAQKAVALTVREVLDYE